MKKMKIEGIPVELPPAKPAAVFVSIWVEGRLLKTPWRALLMPEVAKQRIRTIACRAAVVVFPSHTVHGVRDGSPRDSKAIVDVELGNWIVQNGGWDLDKYCRELVGETLPRLLFALTEGGMHVDLIGIEVTAHRLYGEQGYGGYAATLKMEEDEHGA